MRFNGIQWDLIGLNGIYDGIASGKLTVCDIENGHRNSGFSQLENGGSFHCYVNVYQRVLGIYQTLLGCKCLYIRLLGM